MSHFTVLVIGNNVDEQLAPYDENIEVTPYETECHCIGWKALNDARNKVRDTYKSMDDLREEFKKEKDQSNKNWQHFIKEYILLQEKYNKEHPLYNKPSPDCQECKGTGRRMTTYNPSSKWDWYQIGGRWCGYFKLKNKKQGVVGEGGAFHNEPRFDVDQVKKGDIDWKGMKEDRRKDAEESWNLIQRERKEGKDDTHLYFAFGYEGQNKKQYIDEHTDISTYAVVKDGIWYQRGEMGWWGMSSKEMSKTEWKEQFDKLLNSVDDNTLLTLVDCHI